MIKKKCYPEWLNTSDISSNEWKQIYLQSKSSIESSHKISKLRRNPNPNLKNLVIGFGHQSYAFWRLGLNGYLSLLLGFQRVGLLKRERKMVNWCMPLFLLCFPSSLFTTFFPFLSQFFFVLSFLLFSSSGSFFPWVSLHQLFLVCCGHPFRTVHPPIGCLTTTITR